MWYQAAGMVWCGAMVALVVIALVACVVVMHDSVVCFDRKSLAIGGLYLLVAAVFVLCGLQGLV